MGVYMYKKERSNIWNDVGATVCGVFVKLLAE